MISCHLSIDNKEILKPLTFWVSVGGKELFEFDSVHSWVYLFIYVLSLTFGNELDLAEAAFSQKTIVRIHSQYNTSRVNVLYMYTEKVIHFQTFNHCSLTLTPEQPVKHVSKRTTQSEVIRSKFERYALWTRRRFNHKQTR